MSSTVKKSYTSVLLASAGFLLCSMPVIATAVPTGESIIDCSGAGLSDDYKNNVCLPLQSKANELLNGNAKAPEPVLMTQKLDIEAYRLKGIDAVIAATKGNGSVNPSGGDGSSGGGQEVPWTLSQ